MRIEKVNECKRCCECGEYISSPMGGGNYLEGYSIKFEYNTEVSVTLCKSCMIDLIADFGPSALKEEDGE